MLRALSIPIAAMVLIATGTVHAQGPSGSADPSFVDPTFADLADLADAAGVVVKATVREQAVVPPERAPGVPSGHVRLYVEAQTQALLTGSVPFGQSISYLVDVPLDARGKVPKLKKRDFLLFARTVPGRAGELQLVGPGAHRAWTPDAEQRLRSVLAMLVATDAPPRVTGVRDALSVEGNLAGESETQVFLATADGAPVSLTVVRRPGMAPAWGVSWSEIVDQAASPPAADTLEWYRLACFLPGQLPASANLASDPSSRARAAADYRFVVQQLGPCPRHLSQP